jgi:hypothetical protein
MKKNKFPGAIGDPRTEEEKKKDYLHEETTKAFHVDWLEKSKWNTYPSRSQWYTSECVPYSKVKHLSINNIDELGEFIELNPDPFYWNRSNRPGGGMIWDDAGKIAITKAAPRMSKGVKLRKRETDPEVEPTLEQMEDAVKFRGQAYVRLQNITMDSVAQVIEERKSCLLWFWFDYDGKEWWKKVPAIKYPDLGTYESGSTRHAVLGVDYGLRGGEKVIVIEDSAGNSSAEDNQRRYITEDMLKRCFIAGYVIDFKYVEKPVPKVKFTKQMKFGDRNTEVKKLQDTLKALGLFPQVPSTGFYGGITAAAVEKFQINSLISPTARNNVGPKTLSALNKLNV